MKNNPQDFRPEKNSERLVSLDAFRGFVMLGLASGAYYLNLLGNKTEIPWLSEFLRYQTSHAPWTGCAAWDLVQPFFTFIVGVAMPFSYASRKARGDSEARIARHVLWRAILLIFLGVYLRSFGAPQTYFSFEDVVSQIGLGYGFVYLTLGRGFRVQAMVAAAILVGYYLLFALWPQPTPEDAAAMALPQDWQQFQGFAAHWNKGANPAGYFDQWFLNLFPRQHDWTFHGGGYVTLSFIPCIPTMIFGVMAGELLRGARAASEKCRVLVKYGCAGLVFGLLVDGHIWPFFDFDWSIAPIVKRIWTPSFTIFSTGWALLTLAAFYWTIDVRGYKKWSFVFVVVGMNPITIYFMLSQTSGYIGRNLETHLPLTHLFGESGDVIRQLLVPAIMWWILYFMYRRKWFVRL